MEAPGHSEHVAALWPWVARHGSDAVAFQGLEPGLQLWRCSSPEGAVAYSDTGSAWVAAGGPYAAPEDRAAVAAQFAREAAQNKRRASFFCVDFAESGAPQWPGFTRVLLGEQPVWSPGEWPNVLRRQRKLREQLRRATAKGVRVRRVSADELAEGAPLRLAVEEMAASWLRSRAMEPMGFLVTLAPFVAAAEHRYYLAEQHGRPVAFLSLVPVPARRGWLFEDLLRVAAVQNGTSELLVDHAMRELAADGAAYATTGLAPLSGDVPRLLAAIAQLARPLYDFRGLRRFKQRLHPPRWEQVWMMAPRGQSRALHMIDALRAFASGGLLRFAAVTTARHPGVLAWMLGVPLAPWTLLLAALVLAGKADLLGFSSLALAAWSGFDALLALGLWQASRTPRPRLLGLLAGAASVDALLSLHHLIFVGLGGGWSALLRGLAVLAPLVGAPVLWWARSRAKRSLS